VNRPWNRILLGAAAIGIVWYALQNPPDEAPLVTPPGPRPGSAQPTVPPAPAEDPARQAFEQRAGGSMLRVSGRVDRILSDDREGSPHQRFIIVTDSGQSLLISHNLDLAPRLDGLAVGDQVEVYGEYEWNEKGGLMHWTHDDPAGDHVAGYIEWQGRRYQ
jgi:hypothetical protein